MMKEEKIRLSFSFGAQLGRLERIVEEEILEHGRKSVILVWPC